MCKVKILDKGIRLPILSSNDITSNKCQQFQKRQIKRENAGYKKFSKFLDEKTPDEKSPDEKSPDEIF